MDIQWMKRVDRLAGYPLCGAFRMWDLTRGARAEDFSSESAAVDFLSRKGRGRGEGLKIAVIKFWGMGSLILAAPLFASLKRAYPAAELHLITLSPNRGIVELLGLADQAHYLDLAGGAGGIAANILRFFSSVNRLEPDAVIDLEYLTRFSAAVSYLSRAPVRVGFHSWDVWRGNLHTVRRAFNPYWHATENFLNLGRALHAGESEPGPAPIRLGGREDEEAARLLAAQGVGERERVIAVNPNASTMALARRWPEASFVELMDRMAAAGRGRVVLIGSPEEAPFIGEVRAQTKQPEAVINLAGKSTLSGLVGLLRRSSLLVTNDSGPLHLAGALSRPTVSFFGPETPVLYGPRGPGHVVLYRGIDCSPCINIYNAKTVHCMRQEPECLSGITVDQALAAVDQALGDAR